MPHSTRARHELARRTWAVLAACVLLTLMAPTTARAEPLSSDIQTLALSFFPGADRVGDVSGTPLAAPVFSGQELQGYVFLSERFRVGPR